MEAEELEAYARACITIRGVSLGELYGIDSATNPWDDAIDSVLEHYQYQDHPRYREVYPTADRMPPELRGAVLTILTSKDGQQSAPRGVFH